MSILVDNDTKLAVAGITGREGSFHTLNNRKYGTNVVGGINPKKAGENVEGIPVFADWADTVAETRRQHGDDLRAAAVRRASALEAAQAGVEVVIIITEGIPAHDELKLYNTIKRDHPGTTRHRAELPGHPVAGQGERRHHPGVVLQAGQRRRRLPLRHADLPDRQRAGPEGLRQLVDRRHRRRPGPGLVVHRHHRPVRGRSPDRADRDVR